MQTFNQFLNESAVSWDGMKFQVNINDKNGLTIQFIPDGKTLDVATKAVLAERIHERMVHSMPVLAQSLEYDSALPGAGVIFKFDKFSYVDSIVRLLKSNYKRKG